MLNQPVTVLSGVGPAQAEKYARLGIYTLENLLFYLPNSYQDRTQYLPLVSLHNVKSAFIKGQVLSKEVVFRKRRSMLVHISDGNGIMTLRFFYFNKSQTNAFQEGAWVSAYGDVRSGPVNFEMIHPEYKISQTEPEIINATLTPIYGLTEGITQLKIRKNIEQVLDKYLPEIDDYLAKSLQGNNEFDISYSLQSALSLLHHPQTGDDIQALLKKSHPAQKRLALEELLAHFLSLDKSKQSKQIQSSYAMPQSVKSSKLIKSFMASLGFDLTSAQQRVTKEVIEDLTKPHAMMRLVQGDVGSGKTVVAALVALHAISNGYQVALMAPTELLSEQHYQNFKKWFEALDIEVAFLNGRQKVAERRAQLAKINDGSARFVIGTHALFQDTVTFDNLGLIIVDEQHRFGVNQRLALVNKGQAIEIDGAATADIQNQDENAHSLNIAKPHQLIMTATPIPRSLAMIFYADLDVSTIDELPPGRTPIQTIVLSEDRLDDLSFRVYQACKEKKQVYWVCPLIEESEVIEAKAATDTYETLQEKFPDIRVGLVHGRMKSQEKDDIMTQFRNHDIDLLVATTVIEVGVDVPNASLMIIENAERLGLAQLHQLRGRVGRGSIESVCTLIYKKPLGQIAKERLNIMRESTDGFEIAIKDLEIRGPGDLLGTRQSGLQNLKVADLVRDKDVLPKVIEFGKYLSETDHAINSKIINRWLPDGEKYANV